MGITVDMADDAKRHIPIPDRRNMTKKELRENLKEVEKFAAQAKEAADYLCFYIGFGSDDLYDVLNQLQSAEISAKEAYEKLEKDGELEFLEDN